MPVSCVAVNPVQNHRVVSEVGYDLSWANGPRFCVEAWAKQDKIFRDIRMSEGQKWLSRRLLSGDSATQLSVGSWLRMMCVESGRDKPIVELNSRVLMAIGALQKSRAAGFAPK